MDRAENILLSLTHVTYHYPSGSRGVTEFNLTIRSGERVALMGANGSGKSTVVRLASGIVRPDTGRVTTKPIAYVAQDPHANMIGETVEEEIGFGANVRKDPSIRAEEQVAMALELVGMPGAQKRLMRTLSGGEAQRIAVAAAIVSGAELWVLDEPTSHLPRNEARSFWQKLMELAHELKVGLLYTTHYPQEARGAHRVYCLSRGQVALAGRPGSIFRRWGLTESLGIRFDLGQALWPLLNEERPNLPEDEIGMDEKVARRLCSAFDQ